MFAKFWYLVPTNFVLEHNIERLTTLQLAKNISILMQNKLSLPGTGTKVYFFKEKKIKKTDNCLWL